MESLEQRSLSLDAWPSDDSSPLVDNLNCLALRDCYASCTKRNTIVMKRCPDRAIRIANLFHDLPDREPSFVKPHRFLDIFRRDSRRPQRHTFTPEETAESAPRGAVLQAQRPQCLSLAVATDEIFNLLRRKPPPKIFHRNSKGLDQGGLQLDIPALLSQPLQLLMTRGRQNRLVRVSVHCVHLNHPRTFAN